MALKRKAHSKSRTGCTTCKRRRIKCDEAKPRCSHCVRHEIACVYPDSIPQRAKSSTEHAPSHAPTPTTPNASLQLASPQNDPFAASTPCSETNIIPSFSLKDMSLLHHWTISTSLSVLPGVPAVNQLWQKVFPAIAYKHAYMMHGLISLTALHIAYLNPDDRSANLHIAAHHHTLALSGFRADIDTIGPHNAEAIFATSTLMFFYAFCTFSKLSDADVDKQRGGDTTHNSLAARTSRILGAEWIPLIRGIQTVIHPIYEYLREGPLRSALQLKDWDIIDPDTKPGPDDEHVLRIKHTWAEDENKAVYDETLYLLRKMSAWCVHFRNTWDDHQEEWGYNGSWSAPFIWLSVVSKDYFKLQRQRQPLALLIFAYFGALLEQLHTDWWTDSCGKSIVGVVDDCLGAYWAEWMEWPKRVVDQQQQQQSTES